MTAATSEAHDGNVCGVASCVGCICEYARDWKLIGVNGPLRPVLGYVNKTVNSRRRVCSDPDAASRGERERTFHRAESTGGRVDYVGTTAASGRARGCQGSYLVYFAPGTSARAPRIEVRA